MARKKNAGTSDEVFALTLPLRCESWQRDRLDIVFQCCNNLKNVLIARKLKALRQLERTRQWRSIQAQISKAYACNVGNKQIKEELDRLFHMRASLLSMYGLSAASFESDVKKMRKHYKSHIHSHAAQTIAANVWKAFESYLYRKGKAVRFSKIFEYTAISGKSSVTGIRFVNNHLVYGKLTIPVSISKKDPYGYEGQALARKIHYCKITRKWYPDGWRYFIQLVLDGTPPMKYRQDTGEVLHSMGHGRVGNDIGPQTLATVSDTHAQLVVLADRTQDIQNILRRINRAMDRSRRATNPMMFDQEGRVIPIDKLPADCTGIRHGRRCRLWKESKRYKALVAQRRYLFRKQTEERRQSHNELANRLLTLGDGHYIEDMDFSALAKRSRKTEKSEKTGKYKRKKRFGKSIANRAPALFVTIYEKKVLSTGGEFHRIKTAAAKASQYNHLTKTYKKKHLSQRWNTMPDGSKVQRDLYSAFLIQNTNDNLDGFEQDLLDTKYPVFKQLHDKEIVRLSLFPTPSSTGIKTIV